MEARDLLSGRKVDAEKGCVLKAEMAKKNLHTKRGLSNTIDQSVRAFPYMTNFRRKSAPEAQGIWDNYHVGTGEFDRNINGYHTHEMPYQMSTGHSPKLMETNFPLTDDFDPFGNSEALISQTNSLGFYSDSVAPAAEPLDVFESSLPYLGSTQSRGFSSVLYNSDALLATGVNSAGYDGGNFPAPPTIGMDQNPPCNTLYVGNIPNETSEEELDALFASCPGYKRLSFKTRSNGPMCFVEVEK